MGNCLWLNAEELFEAIENYMAWRGYRTLNVRYEFMGYRNIKNIEARVEIPDNLPKPPSNKAKT